MGYRFANLHVHASSSTAIAGVRHIGAVPSFVAHGNLGWTSVYPCALEEPKAQLVETTRNLSRSAEENFVFALEVYDSDVFRYVLAKNGTLVDQFVSNPGGYNGRRSRPKGGTVDAILPLCVAGTRSESLEILFREARTKPKPTQADREERRRQAKEIATARDRLRREDPNGWYQQVAILEASFQARYPNVGLDDMDRAPNAEELAAHFGAMLGLDRARVVNGFKSITLQRQRPERVFRDDEVLRSEVIEID